MSEGATATQDLREVVDTTADVNSPMSDPASQSCDGAEIRVQDRRGFVLANADVSHVSAIFQQLLDLWNGEESDDYGRLRPTEFSYELACDLLLDAAIRMAEDGLRQVPHGYVSTDSTGGVRVEWIRPNTSVHLVVGASPESPSYLYHENGATHGTLKATAEAVADWLRMV